jgi:hypothetical protein
MLTCEHCLNPVPQSAAEAELLARNVDVDACPCIEAACGHWLCEEMDNHPPCVQCDRCEECCACLCERCGRPLFANEDCLRCVQEG